MAFSNTSDWSSHSKDEPEEVLLTSPEILHSNSTSYLAYECSGEGCFGKVARCIDLNTGDKVAVKILWENGDGGFEAEVEAYEALRALDSEKNNIVKFIENFTFNDQSCLVFEMLDQSLWDAVDENGWCVNDIRPVAQQLLVALEALADIGIVHADLKPDNIMLVNHWDQPFRVKLIDFGLAGPVNKLEVGTLLQPYGLRAPEVMFGLPLTEAIDMWGLGCTLAFLYFGRYIFPVNSSYHSLGEMFILLGPPEEHLLLAGMYTSRYLNMEPHPSTPTGRIWKLKTQSEYEQAEGIALGRHDWPRVPSLEQAVQKSRDDSEYHDGVQFVDFIKSCLHWDAAKRLTPSEALTHSFVTMAHLDQEKVSSSYRHAAHQLMTVCPMEPSSDGDAASISSTDSDTDDEDVSASTSSTDGPSSAVATSDDSADSDCVASDSDTDDEDVSASTSSTDGTSSAVATSDDSADSDCVASDSDTNDEDVSASTSSTDGPSSAVATSDDSADSDCEASDSDTNDEDVSASTSSTDGTSSAVATSDDSADSDCVASDSDTNDEDVSASTSSTDGPSSAVATSDDSADSDCEASDSDTNDEDVSASTSSTDGTSSAVATSDDSADSDCVATVSNSNDDRPSAAAGSADGAAAITPVNTHGLTKKKKKNLFQRIFNFFRRVRSRAEVTNHDNTTGSSATSDLCDCETDTATPTEEVSAAATKNDSADCLPAVSNSSDCNVSTVTSNGAAASVSLNDGAVAAIISADADSLKKKRKKKNLLQRTFKFFGRV